MPKVRMIAQVSGTRDGKDWPGVGEILSVPEYEADDLINARIAEKVVESATAPAKVETATVATTPKRSGLTTASMDK